jgi:hypothetical protein
MTECVVAFEAYSSEVAEVVAAACVYWDYVVDLCAGLPVAYGACGLFS